MVALAKLKFCKSLDFLTFLQYTLIMFSLSKRLIYVFSNRIRRRNSEKFSEKKLIIDFAKIKKSPFDIKSESSYNAYLSNGFFEMGLKKPNCIAWVEIPDREYRNHIVEAKISLDSLGGYASTGLMFRMTDNDSYYIALVSGKGYFRLDVVKDNAPRTLIAWTEVSDFDGINIDLNIVTYGANLIFIVNGKWVGETNDDSINSGRLGFVLASYEAAVENTDGNEYTCKARLDYLAIDTRVKAIEENFKKWNDDLSINAKSRLRLAETYAVMGEASKALDQIDRAWKRREEAIRSVSATYTEVRTKKELLLAARMSFHLGQYGEAEEFIDAIMEQCAEDPSKLANSIEGREALGEKIKILNELDKFTELKNFALKHFSIINKDVNFYTMLARCYWELKEYNDSAEAWDKAFKMNSETGENIGVYAANAANALELTGKKDEALARFLEAGKIFLQLDNRAELAALIPKLVTLGEKNWEARALAGKCAFSIEDYERCEVEFAAANKLRCALRPRPKADPAHYYLWGLVLNMKGRNSAAIRLLQRAVRLAPDYGLFRFKLAEINLTCGKKDEEYTKIAAEELRLALKLMGGGTDGKMANRAGDLLLSAGDPKSAKYFFEEAKKAGI